MNVRSAVQKTTAMGALFLLLSVNATLQAADYITTVAGTGVAGTTGDNGPAINARIQPNALAADSVGTLYIADGTSGHLRIVDANSNLITSVPGATAPAYIESLAVDPSDDTLYVANTTPTLIQHLSGTPKTFTTVAGGAGQAANAIPYSNAAPASVAATTVHLDYGQTYHAGLTIDGGNLYLAYGNTHVVCRVGLSSGAISTVAGSWGDWWHNGTSGNDWGFSGDHGPAIPAPDLPVDHPWSDIPRLCVPTGVAVDAAGNLYILDLNNNCIRKVNHQSGIITTYAGSPGVNYAGTWTDPGHAGNNPPVTASTAHYGANDSGPALDVYFQSPRSIAIDKTRNLLYIADTGNFRLLKADLSTDYISVVAGNGSAGYAGDGGLAVNAQLVSPTAVAVDGTGRVYIADGARVRMVSPRILTSASPQHGPTLGGTHVTLRGANFTYPGTTVIFGDIDVTGTVTLVNSGQLTCIAPPHAVGAVDLIVTNADQQSQTLTAAFNYTYVAPPAIASVTPDTGPTYGGMAVTVTCAAGSTLSSDASVKFDGAAATSVVVASAGLSLHCTPPPHAAGTVDVVVTTTNTLDGQSFQQSSTLANGYTYQSMPPAVTTVKPNVGPTYGGLAVTLTGSRFTQSTSVTFAGAAAASVVVAPDGLSLQCVPPAHAADLVDVVVTNGAAFPQSGTLAGGYTYQATTAVALRVMGYPSPSPANTLQHFTVQAVDAQGNLATDYLGTIHFADMGFAYLYMNDYGLWDYYWISIQPAPYTFQPSDLGQVQMQFAFPYASWTVALSEGRDAIDGIFTLTATDAMVPSITGSQADIGIYDTPQTGNLALTGTYPTTATMAQIVPVTVRVTNDALNPIPHAFVAFTLTPDGGTLAAASGCSNASGNVTVNWTMGSTAGTATLTATLCGSSPPVTTTLSIETLAASELNFSLSLTGADKPQLIFGTDPLATDGFDAAIDTVSSEAPEPQGSLGGAYFFDATGVLYEKDIRPSADTALWFLEVVANQTAVIVSWPAGMVPTTRTLHLQQATAPLVGCPVPGTTHDLTIAGRVTVPALTTQWFVISYGIETEPFVLNLAPGWNLVSLPIEPDAPSISDLFAEVPPDVIGTLWAWVTAEPGHYETATEIHALQGYWVYAKEPTPVSIRGAKIAASVVLQGGWNLFGPATEICVPVDPLFLGQFWWWDTAAAQLHRVEPAEKLILGRGYWGYVTKALRLDASAP